MVRPDASSTINVIGLLSSPPPPPPSSSSRFRSPIDGLTFRILLLICVK
ncbi:MAG: hypothetical protein WBZ20_01655 [Nitrososphaeraceae archaeon]